MGRPGVSTGRSNAGESPVLKALSQVAADERVRAAEAAVREACGELRWNEALRRRWREARAEAAIRGAIASGGVEGAVVSAEVLRERTAVLADLCERGELAAIHFEGPFVSV